MVKNKKVFTPPPGTILPGITRNSALAILRDLKIKAIEKEISVQELKRADELFFAGTAVEVCPIGMVDGTKIGNGKTGPITKTIKDLYNRIVRGQEKRYMVLIGGWAFDYRVFNMLDLPYNYIFFDGEPAVNGIVNGPFEMQEGMNKFLNDNSFTGSGYGIMVGDSENVVLNRNYSCNEGVLMDQDISCTIYEITGVGNTASDIDVFCNVPDGFIAQQCPT